MNTVSNRIPRNGHVLMVRRPTTPAPSVAQGREEVAHLIAGPQGVSICNACVALCNTILTEKEDPPETSS